VQRNCWRRLPKRNKGGVLLPRGWGKEGGGFGRWDIMSRGIWNDMVDTAKAVIV